MPSEGRCMREETRALRGARVRLIRCDASYVAENPVVGSHLSGSSNLGSYSVLAATPQPSWQASLRGFRVEGHRFLVKMWAHNRLVLFLLTICVMLLLCYYLGFQPLQMFRMFGFGVFCMIILGCLPIYCFYLCWRSKWINPLQRKANRILKGLKKQRNKLKRDAKMLRAAMENEEGLTDEK